VSSWSTAGLCEVGVVNFQAGAMAVEQFRRGGHVAGAGQPRADAPDVPVDAEGFLIDDDGG